MNVIDWSRLSNLHPQVRAKFAGVAKTQAMPVDYGQRQEIGQVVQQQNEERGESLQ
ncbi:hypothetical protein [Nitrobacter sp. JJSN]|uniref:hypothetical protein n=1 Tax=Nitrobacter sp. JJSN TaxID=3453033 RepID=UPI003F76EAD1